MCCKDEPEAAELTMSLPSTASRESHTSQTMASSALPSSSESSATVPAEAESLSLSLESDETLESESLGTVHGARVACVQVSNEAVNVTPAAGSGLKLGSCTWDHLHDTIVGKHGLACCKHFFLVVAVAVCAPSVRLTGGDHVCWGRFAGLRLLGTMSCSAHRKSFLESVLPPKLQALPL